MSILFTGRKADLTAGLKIFAEDKLARVERVLREELDAHVVLTREKHRHLVEIVAHAARVGTLTAKADGAEFEESLALAADRLLAQARKHHSKIAKGRKRRAMRASPRRAGALPEILPAPPSSDGGIVVPMGRIPVKPMSVEQAIQALQDLSDPFLVFRDADTFQTSIIFRRQDGRIGLVEPET